MTRLPRIVRRLNRFWLVPLLGVANLLAFEACASDPRKSDPAPCPGVTEKACPDGVPSYANDVAPIIETRCEHCHAPGNADKLWPLDNQEDVNAWSDTILRQIRSCSQPPPDSGFSLSLEERQTLEAWLVCGAPDN